MLIKPLSSPYAFSELDPPQVEVFSPPTCKFFPFIFFDTDVQLGQGQTEPEIQKG